MFRNIKKTITLSLLAISLPSSVLAADYHRLFTFQAKPSESDAFKELLKVELEHTRNFDGCKHLAILEDNEDPNRIVIYTIWDKEESLKAYGTWRGETKFADKVKPFISQPPSGTSYTLID